jgi:phosphate/sulfate permease
MKGLAAGVAAGVGGAVVWALIAYFTGYEIGWIAWGIGAAVGAGVAWGSSGSPAMGVAAVVISVLAILAGKFITVEIILAKELKAANQDMNQQILNDEYVISWLADEAVAVYQEKQIPVNWPEGINPEDATSQADYPADVWQAAAYKWNSMSAAEKEEYRENVRQQAEVNIAAYASDMRKEGFIGSFGIIDIVFFLLAILTAYKIGSKTDTE